MWAGNPEGTLENKLRCIAIVPDSGDSRLSHQCSNKRGKGKDGLYCGNHARLLRMGGYVNVPEDK
jgi:hypothetical protein